MRGELRTWWPAPLDGHRGREGRNSVVRRTFALAAAGLLAAVLPAGLVVAQAPHAVSLGRPADAGLAGLAHAGLGVNGTAGQAGGRTHPWRARSPGPAGAFRIIQ